MGTSAKNILQIIRQKPKMVFGNTEYPFTSLCSFLTGYQVGYSAAKRDLEQYEDLVPADFHKFVTEYFDEVYPAGGKGWSTFVQEHSANELEALELFFKLRDEYDKRHAKAA